MLACSHPEMASQEYEPQKLNERDKVIHGTITSWKPGCSISIISSFFTLIFGLSSIQRSHRRLYDLRKILEQPGWNWLIDHLCFHSCIYGLFLLSLTLYIAPIMQFTAQYKTGQNNIPIAQFTYKICHSLKKNVIIKS